MLDGQVASYQGARIHVRLGPIRGDFKAPAASSRIGDPRAPMSPVARALAPFGAERSTR
jgi:hypothetical protein